jgi:hypothetical protein
MRADARKSEPNRPIAGKRFVFEGRIIARAGFGAGDSK